MDKILHLGFRGRLREIFGKLLDRERPLLTQMGIEIYTDAEARSKLFARDRLDDFAAPTRLRILSLENFCGEPESILEGGELYVRAPEKLGALDRSVFEGAQLLLEVQPIVELLSIVQNRSFQLDAQVTLREDQTVFQWYDLIAEIAERLPGVRITILDGRTTSLSLARLLSDGQPVPFIGSLETPGSIVSGLPSDEVRNDMGVYLGTRDPNIEWPLMKVLEIEARRRRVPRDSIPLDASFVGASASKQLLDGYEEDLSRIRTLSDVIVI